LASTHTLAERRPVATMPAPVIAAWRPKGMQSAWLDCSGATRDIFPLPASQLDYRSSDSRLELYSMTMESSHARA
jgi:hypothetical protein